LAARGDVVAIVMVIRWLDVKDQASREACNGFKQRKKAGKVKAE
jgi:hypothetical protein